METAELRRQLAVERKAVEQNLRRLLNGEKGIPVRLKSAMRHSLMGGGKRLRPVLVLWTWKAFVAHRRGQRGWRAFDGLGRVDPLGVAVEAGLGAVDGPEP